MEEINLVDTRFKDRQTKIRGGRVQSRGVPKRRRTLERQEKRRIKKQRLPQNAQLTVAPRKRIIPKASVPTKSSKFFELLQEDDVDGDKELEILEKKLGFRGAKGKAAREGVMKELSMDGLGDLLAFAERIEGDIKEQGSRPSEKAVRNQDKLVEQDENKEHEGLREIISDEEIEGDEAEGDREDIPGSALEDPDNGGGDASEEDGIEGDENGEIENEGNENEGDENEGEVDEAIDNGKTSNNNSDVVVAESGDADSAEGGRQIDPEEAAANAAWLKRKQKTNADSSIYGQESRPIDSTYVPPHKRGDTAESLKRAVRGLINRLTETNIESIWREFASLYKAHSRREVSAALVEHVLHATTGAHVSQVLTAVVIPTAGLLSALHFSSQPHLGQHIGAFCLERFVLKFKELKESVDKSGEEVEAGRGRAAGPSNLLLLILNLYNFELVGCGLIYDIVKWLCESFSPHSLDLVLSTMQHCGFQLRKDDPRALKDIAALIHQQAALQKTTTDGRLRFVLDMVNDVKNNKRKLHSHEEKIAFTKNWIKGLRRGQGQSKKGTSGGGLQLSLSFKDILQSQTTGRWWEAGAAWKGHDLAKSKEIPDGTNEPKIPNESDNNVLAIAKRQRMNTDVRKTVFCVIMEAQDYLDAFEKLCKLSLSAPQERDMVRVILDCCAQESTYNPYYGHLLHKLCQAFKKLRFTVQVSVWDLLKQFPDHAKIPHSSSKRIHEDRRCRHVALLVLHLIKADPSVLSLSILKPFEWSNLDACSLLFLITLLKPLFLQQDLRKMEAQIREIWRADTGGLLEGLSLYYKRHFLPSLAAISKKADGKEYMEAKKREDLVTSLLQR